MQHESITVLDRVGKGFEVIDLGKDVLPEAVIDAVVRTHAPAVGLSALMITTIPAMEQTVKMLCESALRCRVERRIRRTHRRGLLL